MIIMMKIVNMIKTLYMGPQVDHHHDLEQYLDQDDDHDHDQTLSTEPSPISSSTHLWQTFITKAWQKKISQNVFAKK